MKKCITCNEPKSLDCYYKHSGSKDGRRGECRSCTLRKAAEKLKGASIEFKEYRQRWRKEYNKSPARLQKLRDYNLAKYGMTAEDYESMLKEQEYKCKLCDSQHRPDVNRGGLYVDHCHKTGKIRGLLCKLCNSLIGFSRDSEGILRSAIDYLRNS